MSILLVRDCRPKDLNFIKNSWLRSQRNHFYNLAREEYFATQSPPIYDLLLRSRVKIAVDPEDPDFIYGYLVYQLLGSPPLPVFHYAYTKHALRRFGVMRELVKSVSPEFESEPSVVTFMQKNAKFLSEKYKILFKPELRGV